MSGHSKWAQIKRQKGVTDTRRGQLFTKLTREIMVAVKEGGANADSNFRLRLAVQKARDSNMPTDNIERAIKKASGSTDGTIYSEVIFEGYGTGGTAILIQALTDNRNRILQELKSIFTKSGGSLAEAGSVSWMFEPKGIITVQTDKIDAEELSLLAIDAGADDVKIEKGFIEIHTLPPKMEQVRKFLEQKGIKITSAELSFVPKTVIELDEENAIKSIRLLDKLEELDDIQRVFLMLTSAKIL